MSYSDGTNSRTADILMLLLVMVIAVIMVVMLNFLS